MKIRCVFSTPDLAAARAAVAAARQAGVPDDDISLIAREDIELQQIPDHPMTGSTDFYPAAARGAVCGGGTGVLLLSQDATINTDRNLRLQYLAGLGLNQYTEASIFTEIAKHRTFPEHLFVADSAWLQQLRLSIR